MSVSRPIRLKARWVMPLNAPPISNGVVEIVGDRIAAIHDRPDRGALDLGPVAILPALVNAHTHLEFSHLREPLQPPRPFAHWIRSVIDERRMRQVTTAQSVSLGRQECRDTGTCGIGEIATADLEIEGVLGPLPGVVFREVLGLGQERIESQLEIARRHLNARFNSSAIETAQAVGLSPHAPYSVHPDLLHGCVELARTARAPLAMHVAETREELEFLDRGAGPLADLFSALAVWNPAAATPRLQIPDVLKELARAPSALVVHGNYLDGKSLQFLGTHPQMSLVYCPRTHHFFGHDEYPLQLAIDCGVNVALGTDSRASNPDLDLWQDARFVARRLPQVSAEQILRMATVNGARALGLSDVLGLAIDQPANLIVAACDPLAVDPYRGVLDAPERTLVGAMHRGKWGKPRARSDQPT